MPARLFRPARLPLLALRPQRRRAVSGPPLHVSWYVLVTHHDDPWWRTHFPPNGWDHAPGADRLRPFQELIDCKLIRLPAPIGAALWQAFALGFEPDQCVRLNDHSPGLFPVPQINGKGRVKKPYPYEAMDTPYGKLRALPNAQAFRKPGITFAQLDAIAGRITDNDAAQRMNETKRQLLKTIFGQGRKAG